MKKILVPLKEKSYPIFLNSKPDARALKNWIRTLNPSSIFVVTQKKIKKLHGAWLDAALHEHKPHWIEIPEGEPHKTLSTAEKLITTLHQKGADRKSLVLAFGGGMVGDVAGFAASLYRRGVSFAQIPTTLLAQVDSSVGGKTGVDFLGFKNMVGTFYQPQAVFIQIPFLNTLSERDYLSGFAEVIKMAFLDAKTRVDFLKTNTQSLLNRNPKTLETAITHALNYKIKIVKQDTFDQKKRALLNFGHTLGHAIEAITAYKKYTHGEAVAMGLCFAVHLGQKQGVTSKKTAERLQNLLKDFKLPTLWPLFSKNQYGRSLLADKKTHKETIQFILLQKIGKAKGLSLNHKEILKWL